MCPPNSERVVPGDAAVTAGLGRLLAAVEELPLRYAPFYDRLATLWDLSEAEVHQTLLRARDESAFGRTLLPGVRRLRVDGGPRLRGVHLELLRLDAGAHFPAHRHEGHEVALVLEGSYRDAGRWFEPGDAQAMGPGSVHALRVADASPCVAAVVSRGFAFTALPLRLLQLLARTHG